jgi:hypothetical protein
MLVIGFALAGLAAAGVEDEPDRISRLGKSNYSAELPGDRFAPVAFPNSPG